MSQPSTPSPTTVTVSKLKRRHQTDDSSPADNNASNPPQQPATEMREEEEGRERAAMILGCWEQLSWHSQMYGEVCVFDFFSSFRFLSSAICGKGEGRKGKERKGKALAVCLRFFWDFTGFG